MSRCFVRLFAVCLCLFALQARADEILFKNGDRLSGKLLSLVAGKVTIKTELAGVVTIDASRILTFRTDEPIELHAKDGTVIVDSVSTDEPGSVRVAGTGTAVAQRVLLDDTVAINPPPPEWKGSILAGAEFERGNTIKDSGYAELRAKYETEKYRFRLRGSYDGERTTNRSTRQSTTNDRNVFGRMDYDFFLNEKWLWFLAASGEKDGPSDLDLRFIAASGLGYKLYNRPDFKVTLRGGPSWFSENFSGSTEDEDRVAGLVELDVERQLYEGVKYFGDIQFVQSFEDVDDQLAKAETGIRVDLVRDFFFEAKIKWEWDSEPADDTERQDVDYILGLGYTF